MLDGSLIFLPIKLALVTFILFTLPFTYLYKKAYRLAFSWLKSMIKSLKNAKKQLISNTFIKKITKMLWKSEWDMDKNETPEITCMSPRSKDMNISSLCMRAVECPNQQSKNQAVILLMDKIQQLEEQLFQESKKKCNIQKQLFQMNVKIIQRDVELAKLRRQNICFMKEFERLEDEIQDKNLDIQESQQIVNFLQQQIIQLKNGLYSNRCARPRSSILL